MGKFILPLVLSICIFSTQHAFAQQAGPPQVFIPGAGLPTTTWTSNGTNVDVTVEWKNCVGAATLVVQLYEVTWPLQGGPANFTIVAQRLYEINAAAGTKVVKTFQTNKPFGTYFSVHAEVLNGNSNVIAAFDSTPNP